MFDLVAGATEHIPRHSAVPALISVGAQIGLVAAVGVASLVIGTDRVPEMPTMMAFVADVAPPPPPPPPPPLQPPAPQARRAGRPPAHPEAPATSVAAPAEAPARIALEAAAEEEIDEGLPGGVEGGVPGGQVGGAVAELPAPPPPPPPAQPPPAPVRVGGRVPQPALLQRVEPVYPTAAVDARMQGIVILETIVGEDGRVVDVRILRSAGDLLDHAAIAAIRQWRYAPLELNGVRARFLLTATLSFKLD